MLRRTWACAIALFVITLFVSCGSSDEPIGAAALAGGCLINTDCNSPLVCAFRRCHIECTESRDCPPGQRCVASDRPFKVCQLDQERACTRDNDCPLNMKCGVDGECRDQCLADRDCISGQICVSGTCADQKEVVDGGLKSSGAGGAGNTTCVYSSDCPEPLICRNGSCIVECRVDRDCDYFAACVQGRCRLNGLPRPDASSGGGAGGATGGSPGSGATPGSGGAGGTGNGGAGGVGNGGAGGSVVGPPGGVINCTTRATTGTVANSDIITNETWSGTVHVTQTVLVYAGATLTIAPGTNIVVDAGRSIVVGWNGGAATVLASGTPQSPITFCGAAADPGNWEGLVLEQNATSTSVLENVLVADGGGTNAGLNLKTNATLKNVQVRNSGTDGVWATDFHTGSTALSVDGAVGAAVVLLGPGAVDHFPVGGALTGNGADVARVDFNYVDANTTFHNLGIPYLQIRSTSVSGSSIATFEAGVEYRVAAGRQLEVGWASNGSTILVEGTAAKPVTFRGETAEAGNWIGMVIGSNVTSGSHLRYTKILHAGDAAPALDVRTAITLDNVTLDTNATGVEIGAGGLNTDSRVLTVTRTGGVPITVATNGIPTLPKGGTLTGNTTDQILVTGTDYYEGKGTAPNLGIPYYIDGDFLMDGGASLTIEPGVTFIMPAGTLIEVGWNSTIATFIAKGTAQAPIVFQGLDTTNGYWRGINVRANALSTTAIDHVTIKNAGVTASGGIVLNKEVPVTNSTVTASAGYGIFYKATFTTNYATTNTLTGNTQGPTGTF